MPASVGSGGSGARAGGEAEPAAAAMVFGPSIDQARRYAELLTGPGVDRGLVGPRESGRMWTRHLLNCAVIAPLVPGGARVADVGSGAGLPGIPLALARPDCTVVLIEPLLRRAVFLTEAVEALGLLNCRVVRSRAEDLAPRRPSSRRAGRSSGPGASAEPASARPAGGAAGWEPVDVVTSRAVAALDVLAGWCVPLLRPGGLLLAMKGTAAAEEIRSARPALARLRLTDVDVVTVGAGVVDPPAAVVRARRRGADGRHATDGG